MAIQIHDLKIILSGGTTNSTPDLSLGGQASQLIAAEVKSQLTTSLSLVTGVTVYNAYANEVGDGELRWDNIASRLDWKPFGGVQFNGADIPADGRYVIGDPSGYLVVDVVIANLPGSTVTDTVTVSNKLNNVFDSIPASEATDGRVEYRCLYIKNSHATDTAYDVRVWIKQQPIGPDILDIALDVAGIGNGDTTGVAVGPLADEIDTGDVLTGVAWAQPALHDTALVIGTMAPGETQAFWERRTVPVGTTQQVSNDVSKIAVSALI